MASRHSHGQKRARPVRDRWRDDARREVAHIAARLIAEDGIADFGAAKLKAARQAGLNDIHALPDNREIEEALRTYQALYQADEQPAQLLALRQVALGLMRVLGEFNPRLVGPVLSGTANEFSFIDLHLYVDDCKAVELFFINRGMPYRVEVQRAHAGQCTESMSVLKFEFDGFPSRVFLCGSNDERHVHKAGIYGRSPKRASIAEVESLVAPQTARMQD